MSDWISDLFNIVGYVAGFLFFAVPLAGLWILIRNKRRRRTVSPAGLRGGTSAGSPTYRRRYRWTRTLTRDVDVSDPPFARQIRVGR